MKETFKSLAVKLTLHDTHIEARVGSFPFRRTETIPYRNIASVELNRATNWLSVRTLDGKKHTYKLGGFGRKARKARDLILSKIAE